MRITTLLVSIGLLAGLGGCSIGTGVFELTGAMAQEYEYQKLLRVQPKYDLSGSRVAVLVDADYMVLYEHPNLVPNIAGGVSVRLARDVPEIQVVNPNDVVAWQWRTAQWNAMSYGQMAESLGVDRIVFVDIYEYRLNEPGNRFLWDGACAANVGVVEADGFDPDMFVDTFTIVASYPKIQGVDRTQATAQQIETGVLAEFIKQTAWLFHEHLEPKYPDKFRPEMAPKAYQEQYQKDQGE